MLQCLGLVGLVIEQPLSKCIMWTCSWYVGRWHQLLYWFLTVWVIWYMVDGRKKDAEFVMEYFSDKVDKFGSNGLFPDCFFFDGAANVQRACAIFCTKYPRAISFHGGKHVLSLFLVIWQKSSQLRWVSKNLVLNFFMNISHFLSDWFSKLADYTIFLEVEQTIQSI